MIKQIRLVRFRPKKIDISEYENLRNENDYLKRRIRYLEALLKIKE